VSERSEITQVGGSSFVIRRLEARLDRLNAGIDRLREQERIGCRCDTMGRSL
jgi:hypothetical protein